jgi:hypothetical protein
VLTRADLQPGSSLPVTLHQKLLECSEKQVVWLSVAAYLTWEVPHSLQWWEVRDVALVAQRVAESALASCSGRADGASSGMHGMSVSSGGVAGGARGGYEEQHAWLVVAWALLAIEGACNVATGVPLEDRWGSSPQHPLPQEQCCSYMCIAACEIFCAMHASPLPLCASAGKLFPAVGVNWLHMKCDTVRTR